MKKTSKKSKKITAEDREGSEQWIGLLEATYMFHMQMVKETQSPILGAEPDDEHMFHMQLVKEHKSPIIGAEISQEELFHRASASAIEDCILLIEMLDEEGWFNIDDELPQNRAGPAG